MKIKLLSTLLLSFLGLSMNGQNATNVGNYNNLTVTPQIQFFYGDYFYYCDNVSPIIRRYNLDSKKDTIFPTTTVTPNGVCFNNGVNAQGTIVVNGSAYVLAVNAFRKLNLSSFVWTPLQYFNSPYPQGRTAIVSDGNNYIYVWGGAACLNPWTRSNELWRYDILNDTWFLLSTAPASTIGNNAIYKYPYIYFAAGTQNGNPMSRFNIITNTWTTIPVPPFGGASYNQNAVKHETLFIDNGMIYCIYKDWCANCPPAPFLLTRYDENLQTWTPIPLTNFDLTAFAYSQYPACYNLSIESFYKRGDIIWFTNGFIGNSYVLTYNNDCGGLYGRVNALSFKRQINLTIDSTSCHSPINDSLDIFYRIEYNGAFNASNTNIYLGDINNANQLTIATNTNFFSSNLTVQSRTKRIHKNYLSYYLRAFNVQGGDTIWSTNKYPVNYKLRYCPTGIITPSNPVNLCPNQPVGVPLSITQSTANSYQWYYNSVPLNGQITSSYTATQLGAYYCRLSSTNGCTSNSQTVNIQTISNPSVTTTTTTPSICFGASTTITASGATTYSWMPGNLTGSTITVSPTTTTTYTVTGTNTSGCTNTASRTITVNPLPVITATSTAAVVCAGVSVTLTGGGASTYSWSGGVTNAVPFIPSATTTYTVTGTNANGCVNTATITVIVNPLPVVAANSSSASVCAGNSVTLTGGGASTYSWSGGVTNAVPFIPTATTTYTVTGTNANACVNTATITVIVNPLPTVTATSTAAAVCAGISVTLMGGGATTYSWSGGVTNTVPFIPTATTTYTVTGTNANACVNTATITVIVNPLPTVTATSTAAAVCAGASVTLTGGGASTYSWSGGVTNAVPLIPTVTTTYTVTGTNANGCVNTATITVIVNPLPVVTANSSSASVCSGNSVTLTGGGASTYSWSGGVTNAVPFIPSATTTYTVTGTNASGCVNTATTTVTVNPFPLPIVTATSTAAAVCAGTSVTLTGGGASTYSWSGGVTNTVPFIPTATTTYTVTGANASGCVNTASITVTVNPLPIVTANSTAAVVCAGASVMLTGGGATTYTWNNNVMDAVSFVTTATTNYIVTGIDANGCVNTATITVTVNPLPVVTATSTAAAVCPGASVTLNGGGASTYSWSGGVTNAVPFIPSATTTYIVTGTNASNCVNTATITVTVNPLPVVTATSTAAAVCPGASVTLNGGGASTYSWDNNVTNAVSFVPTATTTYMVTGTDVNGCVNTATITVTVNPLPIVTANSTAAVVCAGASVILTGGGASTYSWSGGVINSVSFITNATITYTVTGTDANGCINTATTTVTVNPLPTLMLLASSQVYCATDLVGSLSATPTGGVWTGPGVTGNSFDPSVAGFGLHNVVYTYTDNNSCTNTAMLIMTVNACVGINETENGNLFSVFPNPAKNQINIKADATLIGSIYTVFDNQGKKVLEGKIISENTIVELENLSAGVYLLNIGENLKQTFKVIKE